MSFHRSPDFTSNKPLYLHVNEESENVSRGKSKNVNSKSPQRRNPEFSNFVSLNNLPDENGENENPTFRLPPRLRERLQKTYQKKDEVKKTDLFDTTRVFQSMENNITPLLRRETFVCHKQLPTKVKCCYYFALC